MGAGRQRPPGGGRFTVTIDGDRALVVKRGPAAELRREARALRMMDGVGVAPRLVGAGPGCVATALLPGAPRTSFELTPADGRALGALLLVVHQAHRRRTGGRHVWPERVRSLAAYRRRRVADTLGLAGAERGFAEEVLGTLPPVDDNEASAPFALLHGDPVLTNVVWDGLPRLVDWEFWRFGDAAEDLAYAIEVNLLPSAVADALLAGYGTSGATSRVDGWRALVALNAGLWFRGEGEPARAEPLLDRAAALAGLRRRPGAPTGR